MAISDSEYGKNSMALSWEAFIPPDILPERIVNCIGLISDTHAPERCLSLPQAITTIFRDVELILHAGDVGELWVLDKLGAIAPTIAVHGNDETEQAQRELPYQQLIALRGQRIILCHTHEPDQTREKLARADDAWIPKLARCAAFGQRVGAKVVVFGHFHIPLSYLYDEVLLVNPGAIASANSRTRQRRQTVALLFICDDSTVHVSHIDLAVPTSPFVPQIDWSAGFNAALNMFSASILSPALMKDWDYLKVHLLPLAPEPFRKALLRVAHRCWARKQQYISHKDLLVEVLTDPDISADVRSQIEAILIHRS